MRGMFTLTTYAAQYLPSAHCNVNFHAHQDVTANSHSCKGQHDCSYRNVSSVAAWQFRSLYYPQFVPTMVNTSYHGVSQRSTFCCIGSNMSSW